MTTKQFNFFKNELAVKERWEIKKRLEVDMVFIAYLN